MRQFPDGRGPHRTSADRACRPPRGDKPPERKSFWRTLGGRFWVLVLVLLALNYLSVAIFAPGREKSVTIPYNPTFLDQVEKRNVTKISTTGEAVSGEFKKAVKYPPDDKDAEAAKNFETQIPAFANDGRAVEPAAEQRRHDRGQAGQRGPRVPAQPDPRLRPGDPARRAVRVDLAPRLRRADERARRVRALARAPDRGRARRRSRSRTWPASTRPSRELTEVVDFLKNPDRYRKLGGRIPRGVLLAGRPGTGKTLLARAVAGEAGVPFFSVSASEFVEAIVGIGASRVRDLFKQAKESQPAIVFIDELDAIGRSRSGGNAGFGGNDEREQTLNQILTEMDGFESSEAVIVVGGDQPARGARRRAAAARPLRPPRHRAAARQGRPAQDPRGAHALAAARAGRRPRPARRGDARHGRRRHREPRQRGRAARRPPRPRARAGGRLHRLAGEDPARRAARLVLTDDEKRRTAYHESGHALVGMLTPGADPVRKVSIIPRTMSLGVTLSAPDVERTNYDEEYLTHADQGRARRARRRGARLRLDELRRRVRHPAAHDDRAPDGRPVGDEQGDRADRRAPQRGPGPAAARAPPRCPRARAGSSTRRCTGSSRRRTPTSTRLLTEHRDQLDALTEALVAAETLDEDDAYAAARVPREREPEAAARPHNLAYRLAKRII